MKYYNFAWSKLDRGFISTLSVTETTVTKALRRIADAFDMSMPSIKRYLVNHSLSVTEQHKPKVIKCHTKNQSIAVQH